MSPDTPLLAACAAFKQAQRDQDAQNASGGWDDAALNEVSDRWYGALDAILDLPPPVTPEGRVALAHVARAAIIDKANTFNSVTFDEQAAREDRVAVRALACMAGDAA